MPTEPERPRIVIVRDPDDTPDTTKLLHRIDDLDRGVLVVHPAPGTDNVADLALAVLAAFGKHLDTRPKQHPRHWWPLARAWTAGHQIDHLIVDRAHTLPAALIDHLVGLAAATQATVWFLDASNPDTAAALAAREATEVTSVHHLLCLAAATRTRPPAQPVAGRQIPPLSMPRAGFLTFRYACERQLPAEHVADVDTAWRATFDATQGRLLRTPPYDHGFRPPPAQLRAALPAIGATLSARLAALLYTAANPATALLRLRATEAALFRYGLLLGHQPRHAGGHQQLLRCPLTPIMAAALNRSVSTNAAAAAVLHLLYPLISVDGRHLGEPLSWRLDNVHPDGSHVITEYGTIPLPAAAHPILRAHLHTRHADGRAAGHTPLIDESRDGQVALTRQALTGLTLASPPRTPWYKRSGTYLSSYATAWMADRGLSLHALTELAPPVEPLVTTP